MSAFEKGLYRWLEITSFGIEFAAGLPAASCMAIRSPDLFRTPALANAIARFVGLPEQPLVIEADRNEALRFHVERRPVGSEWRRVFAMPEVVELATSLGFSMDEQYLSKMILKYQLHGLMPHLRHASGYWPAREALGRWLSKSHDR
jgi:hypothetical protein